MIWLGVAVLLTIAIVYFFMHGAQFGAAPTGERLLRIQHSFHFKNDQFQNLNPTPQLTEGAGFGRVLWSFLFGGSKIKVPPSPIPSVHTDLLHLNPKENILVWFGHSSYFMQIDGRTFLVDPVFSGNASPLSFTTKSFPGTDVYSTDDFPSIDYLFITHDHWDHLDYKTVLKLKPKVRNVITSLGVGADFESWDYDQNILIEMDWHEQSDPENGFKIIALPARHFSGRSFKRNGTVWSSFVVQTPTKKIYIGGDSGYDTHFKEIGDLYGPFDLVILENGQYNESWKYIHMMPEETVQAAIDLKAKKLLPVHWAKFNLSLHAWNDPILRIHQDALKKHLPLVHPMIGQPVNLDRDEPFANWWENVR